jgi:hypothetical protein
MDKINAVTIGHAGHCRASVVAAISLVHAKHDKSIVTESDMPVMHIKTQPMIPDPIDYSRAYDHRKSKGDKHRQRSERKRKWGI